MSILWVKKLKRQPLAEPEPLPLRGTCWLPVWYGEEQDCLGHYGRGQAQAEPQFALGEIQTAQPVALEIHHSWKGREATSGAVSTRLACVASGR